MHVKLLAGWKEEEEASADTHFWLVAQAYSDIAMLVPPGAERENAMGVFLNFPGAADQRSQGKRVDPRAPWAEFQPGDLFVCQRRCAPLAGDGIGRWTGREACPTVLS